MKKFLVCTVITFILVSIAGCGSDPVGGSNINDNIATHTTDTVDINTENKIEPTQEFEEVYSDGLVFKSNGDGTCEVAGIGTCTDTEIRIPTRSRQNDTVTAIGRDAFYKVMSVKKVIIPDTVTEIGNSAFEFSGIEEVIVPDSVTLIDEHAFKNCNYLTVVDIVGGDNLVIGVGAFSRCYGLKNVKLSQGVKEIGEDGFYNSNIESISLPVSLNKIGHNAFNNCTNLETITYEGTVADWMAVDTGVFWNNGVPANEIACADGTFSLFE